MSSMTAASPRASTSFESTSHPSHSQVRRLHPNPAPTIPGLSLSPSAMLPASGQPSPLSDKSQLPTNTGNAGYFGLLVDNADAALGEHSKKNWSPSGSSIRSAAARSPLPVHVDNPSTPFQRQSEALAQKLQRPPTGRNGSGFGVSGPINTAYSSSGDANKVDNDYFSSPRINHSPSVELPDRALWPQMPVRTNSQAHIPFLGTPRSSSFKKTSKEGEPILISPSQLVEFLSENNGTDSLLLDVRTYKLFAQSRIPTAVNLSIPTTLLKRPSFNVAKLSETFANDQDKERFSKWRSMKRIVVYDTDSKDLGDSSGMAALHTLSKFSREGWKGHAYFLKGGFEAFSGEFGHRIDTSAVSGATTNGKGLSLSGSSGGSDKAIGGIFNCPLPMQQSVVNPFWSNIRQNMDLLGGVGEMPVHLPQTMGAANISRLPQWLKEVTGSDQGSKIVADRFLRIEKAEQRRMQDALNVSVQYDSPISTKTKPHVLAGVEKGSKNRYNNIWPYDHSRVKLLDYVECDFINASKISTLRTSKKYIACQAPLPSTFRDFWAMAWEQDVRVIVMLTGLEEGGRIKSHNYWKSDLYGPLRLQCIQEHKVSLEASISKGKRRSVSTSNEPIPADSSIPFVIVRKFTLEHTERPFSPLREITQLHYTSWPDFGTPQHPSHVLSLVEHTEAVSRSLTASESSPSRRPVIVHCSAGCGRTGTFCTVDSVIEMMKRQRIHQKRQIQDDSSDVDGGGTNVDMRSLGIEDEGEWVNRDDEDLVYKAVSEFRDQRISMVQCLQQYVLCYEAVLEWLAKQNPLDSGKRKER